MYLNYSSNAAEGHLLLKNQNEIIKNITINADGSEHVQIIKHSAGWGEVFFEVSDENSKISFQTFVLMKSDKLAFSGEEVIRKLYHKIANACIHF